MENIPYCKKRHKLACPSSSSKRSVVRITVLLRGWMFTHLGSSLTPKCGSAHSLGCPSRQAYAGGQLDCEQLLFYILPLCQHNRRCCLGVHKHTKVEDCFPGNPDLAIVILRTCLVPGTWTQCFSLCRNMIDLNLCMLLGFWDRQC
eukprot:scaffold128245_cov30-Tisochrysis_lutea.AAC.1